MGDPVLIEDKGMTRMSDSTMASFVGESVLKTVGLNVNVWEGVGLRVRIDASSAKLDWNDWNAKLSLERSNTIANVMTNPTMAEIVNITFLRRGREI